MKTNHRDGTKNRRVRHGFNPNAPTKEEARGNRRRIERKACADFKAGRLDAEDVALPTRAQEVSNNRNWD